MKSRKGVRSLGRYFEEIGVFGGKYEEVGS